MPLLVKFVVRVPSDPPALSAKIAYSRTDPAPLSLRTAGSVFRDPPEMHDMHDIHSAAVAVPSDPCRQVARTITRVCAGKRHECA